MCPYNSLLYTVRSDWQIYYVAKIDMISKFYDRFLNNCIEAEITLPRGSCLCRSPRSCRQRIAAFPHKPLHCKTIQKSKNRNLAEMKCQ